MKKKTERTLVILKPDGVKKGLIGKILMRLETTGAVVVNMKMLRATEELLTEHYEEVGKLRTRMGDNIFRETLEYMSSDMIVPVILEGPKVVNKVRKLCGPTRPWEASAGTIRGDFGRKDPKLPIRNIIHASASPEEAELEIRIWFPELT